MSRISLDFSIQEAGSLLYIADIDFGGYPINEFHEFFGGRPGLKELTERGVVMAGSLYQDDGYNVRIVFGELDQDEATEWTSSISGTLNLESGKMIVSGVCDEGLEAYLADFPLATNGGDYELGTIVNIEPGVYSVSIYSYPPNDLAGGWMRLIDKGLFRKTLGPSLGIEFEKPIAYFERTRPGEPVPQWIAEGWDELDFLDFVIQLKPADTTTPTIQSFEEDGCLEWQYRKPEKCSKGIILG